MKNKLSVLAIVLSVIAIGAVSLPKHGDQATQQTQAKESTYDRIMRTKTIRCAYLLWPPFMQKDLNTGKLSGIYFELLERVAKDWSMKVDWAEEVSAANRFDGFATGRYDLLCGPVGATPERTAVSDFSIPLAYLPFYLFTRPDVTRFDNDYSKANDENVSMLTIDGYMAATIIKSEFPKAKLSTLPGLSTDADILMSIQTGKTDASVCEYILASDFMKNNPGKVKRVPGPPLRFAGETIAFPLGELQLKTKLNTTLQYYLDTGVIEKILMNYDLGPEKLLRVAKPYQQ